MLRSRFPVGLLLLGCVWGLGSGPGGAQDQDKASSAQRKPGATAVQPAAGAPRAEPLDPRLLGMTEAVFDYCAKADPKGAAKIHARLKRLVQGASRETLAEVRKSDEYRKARGSVEDFVAKVDERNVSRVCSGPPAGR
jgi:hypothetical protein